MNASNWQCVVGALALAALLPSWAAAQVVVTVGGEESAGADVPPSIAAFEAVEGGFVSVDSALIAHLPAHLHAEPIVVTRRDGSAPLSMQQLAQVVTNADGAVLARHEPFPAVADAIDAATVRYTNVYEATDDEYAIMADRLKHEWVLHAMPALPAGAVGFAYDVRLALPEGATLAEHADAAGAVRELSVVGANGDVLYRLPELETEDAEGRATIGRYRLHSVRGVDAVIAIEVDAAWLAAASYPVRLDPTVITVDTTSTIGNTFPWNQTGAQTYQQTYSAAQLQNTAGMIERIGFQHYNVFDKTWNGIRIYMGETSFDSTTRSMIFDDNFNVVAKTLVFDGTITPLTITTTTVPEYGMFALQTPFFYSGQNTLVIQIETLGWTGSGGSSAVRYTSGTAAPIETYRTYASAVPATSATGASASFFLHARFEIMEGPRIETTVLDLGTEGFPYQQAIQVTGGIGALTYTEVGLPLGLTLDPATGEIAGMPGPGDVGSHSVTITVTDTQNNVDDITLPLEIDPKAALDPLTFPVGTATGRYPLVTPTWTGGRGPFTWSATGLPDGLTIDPDTGEIGGILAPFTAGAHSVSITITDTNGADDFLLTTLEVNARPRILSTLMPRIRPGQAWGPHVIEVDGGTGPLMWWQENLPDGLSIDPETGEISGTVAPGAIDGIVEVSIAVTDANDVSDVATIVLSTLNPAASGGCGVAKASIAGPLGLLLLALLALAGGRRAAIVRFKSR